MVAAKRYWVTVKAPTSLLSTLPEFVTPISKTRLKKEGKLVESANSTTPKSKAKGSNSASSPAPEGKKKPNGKANLKIGTVNPNVIANLANGNPNAISNFKINSGLKESSTSGLTMNSISNGLYTLDKSGNPCRRWVKKPRQFKTFSGFKVKYISYKHETENDDDVPVHHEVIPEEPASNSASATPDIRSEA